MSSGATVAATSAAVIAQAARANGIIVQIDREAFLNILLNQESPLVVVAPAGFLSFGPKYQFLTSYKGLAFHTTSSQMLDLPPDAEVIEAKRMWIPQ